MWSKAVELFNVGAHKTSKGFMEIINIYAAIGRTPSPRWEKKLKFIFLI